jgi:hypothetical protein
VAFLRLTPTEYSQNLKLSSRLDRAGLVGSEGADYLRCGIM